MFIQLQEVSTQVVYKVINNNFYGYRTAAAKPVAYFGTISGVHKAIQLLTSPVANV